MSEVGVRKGTVLRVWRDNGLNAASFPAHAREISRESMPSRYKRYKRQILPEV